MAEFLLETLWVFLLFFIIPVILFVGLYRIGKFLINLINKKFHKQFSSSWAHLLLIPLPVYFVLFFAGGCSFKYIDPQYYKFKELCKNVDNEVTIYNEDYWEMYKDLVKNRFKNSQTDTEGKKYYYYEKLNAKIYPYDIKDEINTKQKYGSITILTFNEYYKNIHYASYKRYNYKNYGIFLKGDEGAGWHWEDEDNFTCSYLDDFYRTLGR